MPKVSACERLELNDDTRDEARMGAHGIFPTGFLRVGRYRFAHDDHLAPLTVVRVGVERLALENLESHEVKVNRVTGRAGRPIYDAGGQCLLLTPGQ